MFKLNATMGRRNALLLSLLPFVLVIFIYGFAAKQRHAANPKDKLIPSVSQLIDGLKRSAFEKDRKGDIRLWVDTWASGKRLIFSMVLIFLSLFVGLYMGLFPFWDHLMYKFVLFFDKIPALAVLPILFIVFGLGETSKIALIVMGVAPTIMLDMYLHVKAFPRELITKAQTLKASTNEVIYKIILPRVFPLVLNSIRLNFKAVVLFLIAGEALAATAGLGYRIFVVRRYIAMEIIIPYVIWISLLAFGVDFLLRFWIKKRYIWLNKA